MVTRGNESEIQTEAAEKPNQSELSGSVQKIIDKDHQEYSQRTENIHCSYLICAF